MQINSNYSMNGVSYETRHKQNNIPQFSTECAVQENENINPYMAEADFDEKAFDMIGPNAPQDVISWHTASNFGTKQKENVSLGKKK